MKTIPFLEFLQANSGSLLTEELHQEIQSVLDSGDIPADKKFTKVTGIVRKLSSKGEDTGIEGGAPKKGSSRAVVFHKTPRVSTVDGQPAELHRVCKIAFPGQMDKYTGQKELLGEMQNRQESDRWASNQYGMLRHSENGGYETNHHGVLAPVFDSHEDHHWVEMGRAEKMTKATFKSATKTESHPKGLDFDDLTSELKRFHREANGQTGHNIGLKPATEAQREKIRSHPMYQTLEDFCANTGTHPDDFHMGNWGLWKHPVTGNKHPVLTDWGFTSEVSQIYQKARQRQSQHFIYGR